MCAVEKSETAYNTIGENHKDVFEGLGCIPGDHSIVADECITPVIHPCRKVPFCLQKDLKKEHERMESEREI